MKKFKHIFPPHTGAILTWSFVLIGFDTGLPTIFNIPIWITRVSFWTVIVGCVISLAIANHIHIIKLHDKIDALTQNNSGLQRQYELDKDRITALSKTNELLSWLNQNMASHLNAEEAARVKAEQDMYIQMKEIIQNDNKKDS